MNVMSRFTYRNLKHNRTWAIVTIIGIIISTAMIAGVAALTTSFITLLRNEEIAESGNWHAAVANIREQDVQALADADFTRQVMRSRNVGYVQLEQSERLQKPYLFITQYDENSRAGFPVVLVDGRLPQNDREIVLPQHVEIIEGRTPQVGDTVSFEVGRRLSSSGFELTQQSPYQGTQTSEQAGDAGMVMGESFTVDETIHYTVTGIMQRPSFESITAAGYTAITYLDAAVLNPEEVVDATLLLHISRDIYSTVPAYLRSAGIDDTYLTFHYNLIRYYGVLRSDMFLPMIYGFAAVILGIIMTASVMLIYNAFTISVSERIRQLGMLASIGATRQQKRHHVYLEAALLAAIGIPIGIAAGIGGIGVTLQLLRPLMNNFLNLSSSGVQLTVWPATIAVAIVFAVITIFISAWIPARRASRTMPIDAIRQLEDIKLTGKKLRSSRIARRLFGFEADIALKNLKRNRKKYRITILSLAVSLVLFLTVSHFSAMISRLTEISFQQYNYDVSVGLFYVPESEVPLIRNEIMNMEPVNHGVTAQVTYNNYITLNTDQLALPVRGILGEEYESSYDLPVTLYALATDDFIAYAESIGVNPQPYRDPDNPQVIAVNYAHYLVNNLRFDGQIIAVDPGESFVLNQQTYSSGSPGVSVPMRWGVMTDQNPVGALIPMFSGTAGNLDGRLAIIASKEVAAAYLSMLSGSGYEMSYQLFLQSDNTEALELQLAQLSNHLARGRLTFENILAGRQADLYFFTFLGIFVYGFITLIVLICAANIFNTLSTNIRLRRKEFAMLRSVGMTPGSFNRMIRYESVFYGLKALLYGLPVSFAISWLLHYYQRQSFDLAYSFPWFSYMAAIALIFAFTAATMLYASSQLKKDNIIDALKKNI